MREKGPMRAGAGARPYSGHGRSAWLVIPTLACDSVEAGQACLAPTGVVEHERERHPNGVWRHG